MSSYIDDISAVTSSFDAAMTLSIRMVYEAAALGLSLEIPKCSLFPRHAMKSLGSIADLTTFQFRLSRSRIKKIHAAANELMCEAQRNPNSVPAKVVARFIGLIWSSANCCHRAASVMLRGILSVLTHEMRAQLWSAQGLPIKNVLNQFWSGYVSWNRHAQAQLSFWMQVDFASLRAPISADVLGKTIEMAFDYPSLVDPTGVQLLFQDASATAAGGGVLRLANGAWHIDRRLFLAAFSPQQREYSSTLREILGVLWCTMALADPSKQKIIFACDNQQTVDAIKSGSNVPLIQLVAERIFAWCLANNKCCWPVWLPRKHRIIRIADKRSRLKIPHDQRSPSAVVYKSHFSGEGRTELLLLHTEFSPH